MIFALKGLQNMHVLCPKNTARLWELFVRTFDSYVFTCHFADDCDRHPSLATCLELPMTLAATFGRKCDDPRPYVAMLVTWLESTRRNRSPWAAIAGTEIAEQFNDAMPVCSREALIRWASWVARAWQDTTVYETTCACRALGMLGDDACMASLQNIRNRLQVLVGDEFCMTSLKGGTATRSKWAPGRFC